MRKTFKVNFNGPNDCWEWTGASYWDGYGQFHYDGETRAHRVSYKFFNDEDIPKDLIVHHTCHNPKCVNPAHLELTDVSENTQEGYDNGSASQLGTKNAAAMLTEDDVVLIRQYHEEKKYTVRELAAIFLVSISCIKGVVYRANWRHI